MKNRNLLIGVFVLFTLSLIACNNEGVSTPSSVTSNSFTSSITTSDLTSTGDSISLESSSTNSFDSSSEDISGDPQKYIAMIINAEKVDINTAKRNKVDITSFGYDGGEPYEQELTANYTTYQGDLTIGTGSVHHDILNVSGEVEDTFEDTFNEVSMIKNNMYFMHAIDYQNNIFEDETSQINLLTAGNVEDLESTIETAQAQVSCGAGSKAYEDLYYVSALGADLSYTVSAALTQAISLTIWAEYDAEQSNQKFLGRYDYVFDSEAHGFLSKYTATQAFYSLDQYTAAEDKTTIMPVQLSSETNVVTQGTLDVFDGELPIDMESTFVQSIELSLYGGNTMEVGEVASLSARILPETAINKALTFTSTNENVIVIRNDSTGTIEAMGPGTCEVIATNIESGVEGRISITVNPKAKPDTGSDEEKADLKVALDKALYSVFAKETYCVGAGEFSGSPVLFTEGNLNQISLSTLDIANFIYNPRTRTAEYVGDDIQERISKLLPLKNNGLDHLSNYYGFALGDSVCFQAIDSFIIHLGMENEISYIEVKVRNNYFDPEITEEEFLELTDDNIVEKLGECAINKWGSVTVYYENAGTIEESYE